MTGIEELQALSYILSTKSFSLITYNNLDETYFPTFLEEYRFIKNHYDTYQTVPDKETVVSKFPDFNFVAVSEPEAYLVKELRESYLFRSLVPDINKIVDLMQNNKTDEALGYLIKASTKVNQRQTFDPVDLISQASIRYDEYMDKCNDPLRAYVTTGLKELDEIIGGWDRREELAVVSAHTNTGKSFFLIYFALHAAMQGLKVGIYSGEMEPSKLGYRLDTFLFNISNYGMTHGDINIQVQYQERLKHIKDVVKNSILVVTPEMLGGNATVSKLKAFIERSKLDMLCIDQLSLMEDERKSRNTVESFANIAKDLKNLQTVVHIPIVAVAQLNREKDGEGTLRTTIENIAGSYDIMRYATTALLLEQKDKGSDDRIKQLEIVVGKARDAKVGSKLHYAWDINFGRLTFVPTDNDATGGKYVEDIQEQYCNPAEENPF